VRTIELSSHPDDALRLARQRRADASQQDQAEFDQALARHELLVRRAGNARDRARSQRRWLAWLRGAADVRKMRRLAPAPPARVAGAPRDAEQILRAGVIGDQQVATELGKVLSDDWVLVRGYCNRLGEIGHLLLGPPGLIAIESRHLGATVSCDGDEWHYRKFDQSGNLVEQGPIADRRGRSPSVQLGEPAGLLEEFLGDQGGAGGAGDTVSMLRVVLFTHPRSRLGPCRNTSVHVVTSAASLAIQLSDMPPVLAAVHRARLEELIARDLRYGEGRRKRSAAAKPPGPGGTSNGARTGRSARSASR
jgi:hypothetical protein